MKELGYTSSSSRAISWDFTSSRFSVKPLQSSEKKNLNICVFECHIICTYLSIYRSYYTYIISVWFRNVFNCKRKNQKTENPKANLFVYRNLFSTENWLFILFIYTEQSV